MRSAPGSRAPWLGPALWTAVVAGVLFVALAAWLVPWNPVPGGRGEAPAAEEYFTAAEIARAEHYSAWARVWSWSALAVSLVVAAVLGFTRLGRRMVARLPGPWWARTLLAVAGFLLVTRLATLPLSLAGRELRLRHGLTNQSLGDYLRDVAVSLGVSVVVTGLLLVVVIGIARRWRRRWPAIVSTGLGAFVLVASFAYPVVIEPLFNEFDPLPEGELRAEVLDVAGEMGVDVEEVLVSDASRRTTTLNAYVSGLGETRRVVLYDTLVEAVPRDQAMSVVAHELAHAKNRDVLVGSVLGATGAAFGAALLALILAGWSRRGRVIEPGDRVVEPVETTDGVTEPGSRVIEPDEFTEKDRAAEPERLGAKPGTRVVEPVETTLSATAVPLILALFAFGSLLAAPIENGISRQIETRADVDALEATGDADGFERVQIALARRSLSDPTPPAVSQLWFGSHPTVLERLGLRHAG